MPAFLNHFPSISIERYQDLDLDDWLLLKDYIERLNKARR